MECPVCLTDTATLTTRCGHTFCFPCMKQWLVKSGEESKPSCPMCRTTIRFKGLHKIEMALAEERYDEQCGQVFDEMFDDIMGGFTDWVTAFPKQMEYIISRGVINELKAMESTFRVMKDLDGSHPDMIFNNITEHGVEMNYSKEIKRDRRFLWENRDKPSPRYERKHVLSHHR
jgi:hypothetical protein